MMFKLNPGQEFVTNEAVNWYLHSHEQIFQYTGGPGTGKSVVLNEIISRLRLNPLTEVAAMSFIGAASMVMRMKGLYNAKTAHSWIYDVKAVNMRDKDGNIMYDEILNTPIKVASWSPVEFLDENIKLIVIDEGYSMPLSMRPLLEKFGIKILVCGDKGQLPPVGDKPAFLVSGKIYELTQAMRQEGRDDIIYICKRVLSGLPLLNGYYGNTLVIDSEDITDDMLLWADIVICGKNRTRDVINNRIRRLKGFSGDLPNKGEKIICRKNNWLVGVKMDTGGEVNLVNGLIGTVLNDPDVSGFDGKMFTVDFKPDLVNVIFKDLRCNYQHIIAEYATRDVIRGNRYEPGDMFEYGYAITAYLGQGGQWHKVLYIEESMMPTIQNQLNNVGASRPDQALIYAKPGNLKF